MVEAEMLQRLKETHQQQRLAIQEVEMIMKSTGGAAGLPFDLSAAQNSKRKFKMLNNPSLLLNEP
jgi:hypothetical protein